MEIGLVLKEVEMSPRPVLGVVDLAFRRVGTRGTGELRAFGEVGQRSRRPSSLENLISATFHGLVKPKARENKLSSSIEAIPFIGTIASDIIMSRAAP
jgi:hypothetical protein